MDLLPSSAHRAACGRGSVSHNRPRCEGPGGEVVGMDGTPLPLLSNSSPLSSPLSPSNKLPCGPIWFNFLCPLKGNETSGEDLRESKREDVSDGDVSECARAPAVGLRVRVRGGECICHLVQLVCM